MVSRVTATQLRSWWALSAAVFVGCAETPQGGADAGRDAGAATADLGPAREADGCLADEPGATRSPLRRCVLRVEGEARAYDGAPLAGRVITVCGPACFVGTTDAAGRFSVPVDVRLNPAVYSVQVHGRPEYASRHFVMPGPGPDGVVRMTQALRLPRYSVVGAVIASTGGGRFEAGEVVLNVAPSARVEFDLEEFEYGELGQRLRWVLVRDEGLPEWAPAEGVAAMFALAPFNLTADQPMGLSVPNVGRLAAGAQVEFVMLDNDILSDPPNAGRGRVVARGAVSDDGLRVSTGAGEGLRVLTWVGVRPATRP